MDRHLRALSELNKSIKRAIIPEPTGGKIELIDNGIFLNLNGNFRVLEITYSGEVSFENLLPNGYYISVKEGKIRIINILGLSLALNSPILNFYGKLNVRTCRIITFRDLAIDIEILNIEKTNLVEFSKTKVEDDTLILYESSDNQSFEAPTSPTRRIDTRAIKGLYSKNSFPNGYSGYYNYDPESKGYFTRNGRAILNQNLKYPHIDKIRKRAQQAPPYSLNKKRVMTDEQYKNRDIDIYKSALPNTNQRQSSVSTKGSKLKNYKKGRK
tara:strand:- start:2459 stop:3268 length:810 start_codon:yes stop_codon:yes gene_type:complete